ncbi:hypothetical protein [Ferrimonas marina]|uniref:Uncharacterized protein n=1 Tax=Ferrimonas marina TaxID=299255 RepID=A0A1M5THZ6_9GAMM|nr:hypothetical protein [Ferrimonas marina]SHH50387.1 hypothetical protein SAMN02745129_2154 [Ferrimonas marina]
MRRSWWGVLALVFIAPAQASSVGEELYNAYAPFVLQIAYLAGLILFGSGIYGFYRASKGHGDGSTNKSAFATVIAGTALLSVGTFFSIWAATMWGEQVSSNSLTTLDPALRNLANTQDSFLTQFMSPSALQDLFAYLQLLGVIAFVRGTFLIKDLGLSGQSGQAAGPMKVFSHIIGGVLLINLSKFGCMLHYTFDISALCVT